MLKIASSICLAKENHQIRLHDVVVALNQLCLHVCVLANDDNVAI